MLQGTAEERGLTKWLAASRQLIDQENEEKIDGQAAGLRDATYDIPFITPWLRKYSQDRYNSIVLIKLNFCFLFVVARKSWSKYIPISPTYDPLLFGRSCRKRKSQPEEDPATAT